MCCWRTSPIAHGLLELLELLEEICEVSCFWLRIAHSIRRNDGPSTKELVWILTPFYLALLSLTEPRAGQSRLVNPIK